MCSIKGSCSSLSWVFASVEDKERSRVAVDFHLLEQHEKWKIKYWILWSSGWKFTRLYSLCWCSTLPFQMHLSGTFWIRTGATFYQSKKLFVLINRLCLPRKPSKRFAHTSRVLHNKPNVPLFYISWTGSNVFRASRYRHLRLVRQTSQ